MFTFGATNLEKIAIAPLSTSDKSPKVKAFQVFKAINVKAKGTNTAVLNFRANKNGNITLLTSLEDLPRTELQILTHINKLEYII